MGKDKAKQTRKAILQAASSLVYKEGVNKLTLEAVAKRAGVSKGGLLYHFSNKDILIAELVKCANEEYVNDIRELANQDMNQRGKWTRAVIQAATSEEEYNRIENFGSGLLAAMATNPDLLTEIQKQYVSIQNEIEHDGLDAVEATIARLAVDGLYYADMFSVAPIRGELREKVVNRLMKMTKEE
ncbi:TetR/AcrR family transcriptional regulator [Bacillus gaemokensis]|uniref:HTH tetR-type domain-containing protein n=1 Tax=Bacillus gaemokensis TaxID=574375 RepID=A0A073KFC1_9BACI|nr:TetR/AcrR family transcriptional regulator [Bacillus gaemokensis]KEK25221.1 hypothetical protein BAGA_11345 [Bacillus gaemokensis]